MVYRNKDMSSTCRYFRTSIMTKRAKLLIADECATVAEERQDNEASSHSNNNYKRREVNAASRCWSKTQRNVALVKVHGTVFDFCSCNNTRVCRIRVTRTAQPRLAKVFEKSI